MVPKGPENFVVGPLIGPLLKFIEITFIMGPALAPLRKVFLEAR